ncbi:MAG: MauE/DoxX family redox-associated membrane protein [Rhodanobacter sp.]
MPDVHVATTAMGGDMYSWADAVSAGCLSTVFFISAYKKVSDRKSIVLWVANKAGIPLQRSLWLLAAMVLVDISLGGAALLWGPSNRWVLCGLGVLLLAMLFAGRLLFARSGCPCFGVASMVDGRTNTTMVATVLGLSALVAGVGALGVTTSCLTLLSALLVLCGFRMGASLSRAGYAGLRAKDVSGILPAIDGVEAEGKTTALVFVSIKCPVCMVFLKYLEKVSMLLGGTFNLIVLAEGMNLEEPCRFGGGFICGGRDDLRQALKVRLSPALVIASKGHSVRYSGIDACNLGVGKMLVAAFNGGAKA